MTNHVGPRRELATGTGRKGRGGRGLCWTYAFETCNSLGLPQGCCCHCSCSRQSASWQSVNATSIMAHTLSRPRPSFPISLSLINIPHSLYLYLAKGLLQVASVSALPASSSMSMSMSSSSSCICICIYAHSQKYMLLDSFSQICPSYGFNESKWFLNIQGTIYNL